VTDEELSAEYRQRHANILVPLAERLQAMLADAVAGLPRIDRVAARAKSPDRFLAKAVKQNRGVPKNATVHSNKFKIRWVHALLPFTSMTSWRFHQR
jgi:hypothetical protein